MDQPSLDYIEGEYSFRVKSLQTFIVEAELQLFIVGVTIPRMTHFKVTTQLMIEVGAQLTVSIMVEPFIIKLAFQHPLQSVQNFVGCH